MSQQLDQYKNLTQELARHEAEVERIKAERELVTGQLLAQDGKGHLYDLGDGVERIICCTKIGTHYMAPKNKWVKQTEKEPKAASEAPQEPKVAAAAKAPKAPKVQVKRAIVNGQVVEVPIEAKKPVVTPPSEPPKQAVQVTATEPVVEPVPDTSVAPEAPAPALAVEPQTAPETPPELTEKESLDAVLAALGLS